MSDEADAYFARRQRKLKRWAIVGLVIVALGIAIGVIVATCTQVSLAPAGAKHAPRGPH